VERRPWQKEKPPQGIEVEDYSLPVADALASVAPSEGMSEGARWEIEERARIQSQMNRIAAERNALMAPIYQRALPGEGRTLEDSLSDEDRKRLDELAVEYAKLEAQWWSTERRAREIDERPADLSALRLAAEERLEAAREEWRATCWQVVRKRMGGLRHRLEAVEAEIEECERELARIEEAEKWEREKVASAANS
jgi:chromosome segregation ATPase